MLAKQMPIAEMWVSLHLFFALDDFAHRHFAPRAPFTAASHRVQRVLRSEITSLRLNAIYLEPPNMEF